jgi:hypothetical protein
VTLKIEICLVRACDIFVYYQATKNISSFVFDAKSRVRRESNNSEIELTSAQVLGRTSGGV